MPKRIHHKRPGLVVLFGSGEMSPTGGAIHEAVFKKLGLTAPVTVGILETPTGFEVNAIHGWPERMEKFFQKRLSNYKPIVKRIRAWRHDGEYSTNNPSVVDAITGADYLYCGAGSPGYTIRHLAGSRAYANMFRAFQAGSALCLGSATAVAISRFALPVYEIFKTGADLHWLDGLDLLGQYGLNLAVVPHWNNEEGEDFDTTRCWMGTDRYEKLRAMLPVDCTILGIDEQTACVLDIAEKSFYVLGTGSLHVERDKKRTAFRRKNGVTSLRELM